MGRTGTGGTDEDELGSLAGGSEANGLLGSVDGVLGGGHSLALELLDLALQLDRVSRGRRRAGQVANAGREESEGLEMTYLRDEAFEVFKLGTGTGRRHGGWGRISDDRAERAVV
jgi:hypothetical protein